MAEGTANPSARRARIARLVILGIFVLVPVSGNDYLVAQLTQFIVYGLFAMSLSLVWGQAGILCFGHAIFFGLGAYVMALVTKGMVPGLSDPWTASWVGLGLALLSVAFFAATLGFFLFYGRLSGPYLGIVTLAISVIMERIAVDWYAIGGFNGLTDVPPPSFFGWEIAGRYELFYLILATGSGIYFLCQRIVQSPFGTILAAMRDNEARAESFGFNSANYKTAIFTAGALVAGLAGAMFATVTEFVSPTLLGFGLSTEVLIWVALGGKEVLLAAFLGAVVVRGLEAYLSDILTYYWILILGLFFVVCVMFFPRGMFGRLFAERELE